MDDLTLTNNRTKFNLLELNILRGIAVIFMLVNHLCVNLNEQLQSEFIIHTISFIGSFAPVIFFFVTGFGAGLSFGTNNKPNMTGTLNKTLILIGLDLLIRYNGSFSFGIDFLAFIGISILMLELLKFLNRPILFAVLLILMLIGMRYGLGTVFQNNLDNNNLTLVKQVLGIQTFQNISYWFSPWMTYPLLGFIAGVLINVKFDFYQNHIKKLHLISLILSSCIFGISLSLANVGFTYFRWGTVSVNFYLISLAMILVSFGASYLISKSNKLNTLISLRGVTCLLVVPIHYFILKLFNIAAISTNDLWLVYIFFPTWCLTNFWFAKLLFNSLLVLRQNAKNIQIYFLALIFLITLYFFGESIWIINTFILQLLLCSMLVSKPKETNINA
jgi:hypothetical protein